jgi:uncharacterized protein (TIGR03437 family)
VAVGAAGDLYIADILNNRIRKVGTSGIISTVAGDGTQGYSGDGGPATIAKLTDPAGLAVDGAGNLYIADSLNNRIRKVGTNGIISTVAGDGTYGYSGDGGSATSAELNDPFGAAIDPAGNLYIADRGSNVIRRVSGLTTSSAAAPAVSSVVNAYSLVGGVVAPGEIIYIYGTDLATGSAQATLSQLPTTLAGTQVLFDGLPAYLLSVGATQISLLAPYALAGKSSTNLVVSSQGAASAATSLKVATAAPGLSTVSGTGSGPTNASDLSGNLITSSNPARSGEVLMAHLTGGGQTNPSGADNGQPSPGEPFALPMSVSIGGQTAQVSYAGTSMGAFEDRVVFTVPQGVAPGNAAIVVTIGGVSSQQGVTIPIANISATTITLKSSLNPSAFGQAVTLTAAVSPATATGSVTFKDGSSTLGSSALSGGAATFTISTFSVGTHSLTAVYSGDANDSASTSAVLTQTVNAAATSTSLTSSANPSVYGQSVTLTASVSPAMATGSVTFRDGTATLGTSPLAAGSATLSVATLAPGTHSLTAVFSGDANDAPSTSTALSQLVSLILTITTLTSSPNSPVAGQSATLTATVTPVTATGIVTFNDGSSTIGTSALSGGAASVVWTPATAGAHSLTAVYGGDSYDAASTAALNVSVQPAQAPVLNAAPTALSVIYQQGSAAPLVETLGIAANSSAPLNFSVAATMANGSNWLFPGEPGGVTPGFVNVFLFPTALSPGSYSGTLMISAPGATSVVVSVSLTVVAPSLTVPAQLSVAAPPLALPAQQGGAPVSGQIQVSNVGGGVLNFVATATTISGSGWLSVSTSSGTIDNSAGGGAPPAVVTVTCNPGSLTAGTYQGYVTVTGGGTTWPQIPVTCSVSALAPVILVPHSGLSFTAAAQGGAPLPQQTGVLNIGSGTLNWTAQAATVTGAPWLLISPASGTVQRPYLDVSPITVSIDPNVVATLTPGDYYGQIQVADANVPADAVNSPQFLTVILTVLPPGTDPGPEISPSSLIFTSALNSSENVAIGIRNSVADQYTSIFQDLDENHNAINGFTVNPSSSAVAPSQPAGLLVTPEFSALTPGDVYNGAILLQFDNDVLRTVNVLTVVAPSATGDARFNPRASSSCNTLILQWRTPTPPSFSIVQGHGQTLELQVVDGCGNPIANPTTAAVAANFSNKDPALSLVHVGNGVWTGTWAPANVSTVPVTVEVTAFNSTGAVLQSGAASTLSATVTQGMTPQITSEGPQQGASYVYNQPIAPGTLITLKGQNLADGQSQQYAPPYPTTVNNAQVLMGTEALPILYTESGQLNVQVPYDVPLNTLFQVTIQRESLQSVPVQLVIAEAQPGVFTVDASGSGPGFIFRSDGVTLAQPVSCVAPGYTCSPATAGEMITVQCAGLGAVTPPVQAGLPPPATPISSTVNPVSVTISGVDAQATVGTLIPGRPGVYQVTATVPAGVSGDALPVVVTVAGQSSPAQVTMAVQ